MRALARRGRDSPVTALQIADLLVDTVQRRVQRAGQIIDRTAREYRLLEFLMRSPGKVCARMAIAQGVWDYDFDPGTNLVDVYVMRLRDKIDANREPRWIHTLRGVGYILQRPAP